MAKGGRGIPLVAQVLATHVRCVYTSDALELGGVEEQVDLYQGTDDSLWTLEDVAAYLKTSVRTARRVTSKAGFPVAVPVGERTFRWIPHMVRAWAVDEVRRRRLPTSTAQPPGGRSLRVSL